MRTNKLPRLAFQGHSQLGDDHWHCVLISLLRGLAAIEVAAAHLRATMYPSLRTLTDPSIWYQGLAFVTGFSHQSVLVFFVISGWLVGGSLLSKIGQPNAIANYAIDRVTRLWTVLIPTFLLTLLIGHGSGVISTEADFSAANEFSALAFAGNLVGLQPVALPDFGGNFALWSLANETWYYVMFPLLAVVSTARRAPVRLACGAALALLAAALPWAITLFFSVWLLGVAFSRIRIDCGNGARYGWLALFAALSVYFRLSGDTGRAFSPENLGRDLVLALMFAALLSSLQFKADPASALLRPTARVGKFFAEFSFSLYVLHVPLIFLMRDLGPRQLSPADPLHFAIYFGMLGVLLVASYLSWHLFESQTGRIRKRVKTLVLGPRAPRGAACAPQLER